MVRRFITFFLFAPLFLFAGTKTVAYSSYPPKDNPLIVIDAGHGGLDLGARGRKPFCEEKRVALACALLAKKYLSQLGYRVILTRASDVFIPLPRRVHVANRSQMLVSLHFNSSPNKEAHGIEIFYCENPEEKKRTSASRKLATIVLEDVIQRTKAKSRGVKRGNFFVIRESKVPSILVEGGFISNTQERTLLRDRQYLEKIAKGVAEGVDKYFKG